MQKRIDQQKAEKMSDKLRLQFLPFGKKAFTLFLVLLMTAFASAATDISSLSTGVTETLSSLETVLLSIGGVVIGLGVIYAAVQFIRRMLH
jgi:hypothetical protein